MSNTQLVYNLESIFTLIYFTLYSMSGIETISSWNLLVLYIVQTLSLWIIHKSFFEYCFYTCNLQTLHIRFKELLQKVENAYHDKESLNTFVQTHLSNIPSSTMYVLNHEWSEVFKESHKNSSKKQSRKV